MHILQVGVGSGGIVVLDLVARDPRVTRVTIVEPDVYRPHNVYRHIFPASAIGRLKAELAVEWLRDRRPDLECEPVVADLTEAVRQPEFARLAAGCDVGVCAVDNEPAKYAFDGLMRRAGKPWALGEVLSGGIGGWVHRFTPGGPCYGCVASHLQRTVTEEPQGPAPDYSNPSGAVAETRIPADKASIGAIASLHALVTLELLALAKASGTSTSVDVASGGRQAPDSATSGTSIPDSASGTDEFTSLLFALRRVSGVFDEVFRSYRFRIPRSPGCLVCGTAGAALAGEDLDVAVGEALGRLGAP